MTEEPLPPERRLDQAVQLLSMLQGAAYVPSSGTPHLVGVLPAQDLLFQGLVPSVAGQVNLVEHLERENAPPMIAGWKAAFGRSR